MTVIVQATDLTKVFTNPNGTHFNALDQVNLQVKKGQLTAIVGPDGAGKTTFMRLIAGLMQPSSGELSVLGIDVTKDPETVQSRISYMPQRFGLYEDLSVLENLNLYADLHAVPLDVRETRFARMLEMTDMDRFVNRPAGKLSGGMKQKLALVCSLVRTPDLLLLDEPSIGVDPLSRRDLWAIVQKLVEAENLSVIVNTAYMDEAERCEQVFVMHEGKVLANGTPAELRNRTQGLTYCISPPTNTPARTLQAKLYDLPDLVVDAVPQGGDVSLILQPNTKPQAISALLDGLPLVPRTEQLEDTFMLLLREHQGENNGKRAVENQKNFDDAETQQTAKKQQAETQNASDEPAIIVKNLVRTFGDFTAVASTSFNVQRGEIFGLLGPNGAGKTTTFRMLCGLLPASSGELQVAGMNLRTVRAAARAKLGYVAQKFSLYGNLSVQENLEFFGSAYGLRGKHLKQRVASVIEQFQLSPNANSGEMPTGYKQRLAMAAGLIHQPEILFLDEPTSGIDPLARRAFWRTITELAETGVTVIITTHFMEEAEYCDRIAIQDAGKLLALGTPKEVRLQAGGTAAENMNAAFIAIVEQGREKAGKAQKTYNN